MSPIQVLAADAARARFLSLERPPPEDRPRYLAEHGQLRNPEALLRDSEVYTEPRPGLRYGDPGGPDHAVDDHRERHQNESDRRFAHRIAEEMMRLCQRGEVERFVVTAGPQMLGRLREALAPLERLDVRIIEVPKDLTGFSPHELLAALEREGAVPKA